MEMMKSLNCKELTKCDVVDVLGTKVGTIGDMTFTFDKELNLSQFVLVGSKVEELLEAMRLKPDRDPLFDASLIRWIGDKVQLKVDVDSLKTTLDQDAISKDEIRWSKIQKMDIIDKDDVKVGRALDIDFELDTSASLIVGGGIIEETLEALSLKADIDIIVPSSTIESIGDKIKLKVSKDDLKLTMDEALKSSEVMDARSTGRATTKVHLYNRPL